MKTKRRILYSALAVFALACFACVQDAPAVNPPPDGGYPGGNTAEGTSTLLSLTSGTYNTAVGFLSLRSATTGNFNTAIGAGTLFANTTGAQNTANGYLAPFNNITGSNNTAKGVQALYSNTTGDGNAVNGFQALYNNTEGIYNIANGFQALYSNTTGRFNVANGYKALYNNAGGYFNVAIGDSAGQDVTGSSNVCIGTSVTGVAGVDNTTWIRNVYDSVATGRAVYVDSDYKIGTLSSSRRYKDEIKPMAKASEAILSLKPVSFRYKKEIDRSHALSFGLIAEEVANVDSDLVTPDRDGKPETVRYEAVNAMLLNEFLKEHHKVESLKNDFQATVAQQQNEIVALIAMVKEQASQIQKVSAQLAAASPSNGRT